MNHKYTYLMSAAADLSFVTAISLTIATDEVLIVNTVVKFVVVKTKSLIFIKYSHVIPLNRKMKLIL
jgi:hypothetical protein